MTGIGSRAKIVRTLAWSSAAVVLIVPLAVLPWSDAPQIGDTPLDVAAGVAFLLLGPVYAVTGAMIISRRPDNGVGWILTTMAVGVMLAIVADILAPAEAPSHLSPWLALAFALGGVSWVFFIFPVFHLMLTFPSGRVVSPGWRSLVVLEAVMVSFMIVAGVLTDTIEVTTGAWTAENPIGFIPASILFGDPFEVLWTAGLLVLTVGGVVSVVVRYRRAHSVERQQIKYLLFAVIFFAVVYGGGAALIQNPDGPSLFDVMLPISLMGIGLAIALSVLRYRLYDIDRIISRTVTYALVAGLLVGGVAGMATLAGTRFSQPLMVAATTLGVAATFNPLRRRIQTWVDRRFNRSRYDAERVMDEFAGSMRERVDPDGLLDGWVGVVSDTMQPSSVAVWVRK